MKKILLIIGCALLTFGIAADAYAQESAVVRQEAIRDGIVDIQYPVVELENAQVKAKINAVFAEHIASFRTAAAENPYTTVIHGRYALHENANGILSLTMTDYVYTGGAHGMSYKKGYTFDLASGELYSFNDLLPRSHRERVDNEIRRQIAEKQIPMLTPFKQVKEEPDFYLLPGRKLVIFYQLYELAPYAWGFVTFPMEY